MIKANWTLEARRSREAKAHPLPGPCLKAIRWSGNYRGWPETQLRLKEIALFTHQESSQVGRSVRWGGRRGGEAGEVGRPGRWGGRERGWGSSAAHEFEEYQQFERSICDEALPILNSFKSATFLCSVAFKWFFFTSYGPFAETERMILFLLLLLLLLSGKWPSEFISLYIYHLLLFGGRQVERSFNTCTLVELNIIRIIVSLFFLPSINYLNV